MNRKSHRIQRCGHFEQDQLDRSTKLAWTEKNKTVLVLINDEGARYGCMWGVSEVSLHESKSVQVKWHLPVIIFKIIVVFCGWTSNFGV